MFEVQGRIGSILINEWSGFLEKDNFGQLCLCFYIKYKIKYKYFILHPIAYSHYSNPGIQSYTMLKTYSVH